MTKLWSESRIDDFLQRTVGKEALPETQAEMVNMARAALNTILSDYESADAKKKECAHIALEAIDKVLVASALGADPDLRARGLHLALESLRISFLIIREF